MLRDQHPCFLSIISRPHQQRKCQNKHKGLKITSDNELNKRDKRYLITSDVTPLCNIFSSVFLKKNFH